jgi:hypothetical protein
MSLPPKLIDCALTPTGRTSGSMGQTLTVFRAFSLVKPEFQDFDKQGLFPKTEVLGKLRIFHFFLLKPKQTASSNHKRV